MARLILLTIWLLPGFILIRAETTMKGKVVVITGALVAGIDHAAPQLAATAEQIELGGVDLTDAAQAKKAIDAAAAHFGAIDALINIAGGFTFETIADGDPKA